ncbi:hypothetical protein DVH24_007803 [Malus domestica]|uniref:MADS-box domain-containing protein n=1 Tax=Malus domestica TaxID=3750 RepID=A0A498JRB0_MALDO|nr:hypothetical protein DVH24_007803 [Malus domestica]
MGKKFLNLSFLEQPAAPNSLSLSPLLFPKLLAFIALQISLSETTPTKEELEKMMREKIKIRKIDYLPARQVTFSKEENRGF